MARLSLPLLATSLFAASTLAQNPIPVGSISPNAGGACPCYIIADVRGILFGTETVTQTDVVVSSTAVGKNGTAVLATTIFAPDQPFTLAPTGLVTAAPAAATVFNFNNGTVIFAGLTLSGPSAIDVFTAYTYVTGTPDASGNCVMSTDAPSIVSPAYTVNVPLTADLGAAAVAAEVAFGQAIALPTCTAGGVNIGVQTQVPGVVVTVTQTTTGPAFVPTLSVETIGGATTTVTSTVAKSTPTPTSSPSTSSPKTSSSSSSSSSVSSISPTKTITVASTSTSTTTVFTGVNNVTNTATDKTTTVPTIVETYLPPGYGQTSTVKFSGAMQIPQSQLFTWMASLGGVIVGIFAIAL